MKEQFKKIKGYQPLRDRIKLKGGNLLLWLDENNQVKASSYCHWKFITNMNGLYIFNWYSYSNTTTKHQYAAAKIMRELGLNYITVEYRESLGFLNLETILDDKIKSLYLNENKQALSRATKYAVYTESQFNDDLEDIKKIATALKISDAELNKKLLTSQDAANDALIDELVSKHEKELSRRTIQKLNNDLSAITL